MHERRLNGVDKPGVTRRQTRLAALVCLGFMMLNTAFLSFLVVWVLLQATCSTRSGSATARQARSNSSLCIPHNDSKSLRCCGVTTRDVPHFSDYHAGRIFLGGSWICRLCRARMKRIMHHEKYNRDHWSHHVYVRSSELFRPGRRAQKTWQGIRNRIGLRGF